MKLKERDSKRSMDILVREYPNKTGLEIQEIYKQDIQEYNNYCARINKKKLERIKWLTDNPYLKIVYKGGSQMVQYLHVISAELKYDEVVFSSVTSNISKNSVVGGIGWSIDTKEKERENQWRNHYTGYEDLIVLTKEQYDDFHNKIELLTK